MKHALLTACLVLGGCAQLTNPGFVSFSDGTDWALTTPLRYQVGSSTAVIEVPAGFVTDFASSPRAAWSAIPRIGPYQFAAVVHDYLYWEQSCTKDEADRIIYLAMKEAGVPLAERGAIYLAVSAAGDSAWQENRAMRRRGYPRLIPRDRLDIPPGVTWPVYQAQLVRSGVRAPPAPRRAAYCDALGSLTVAERGW